MSTHISHTFLVCDPALTRKECKGRRTRSDLSLRLVPTTSRGDKLKTSDLFKAAKFNVLSASTASFEHEDFGYN